MRNIFRLFAVLGLLLAGNPTIATLADDPGNYCLPDSKQESGGIYRICFPETWNGDLVVYAHGYVSPLKPVGIPEDQLILPDGSYIPDLVNDLGYAFATTSYRENGLAILPGIADILDLVKIFRSEYPLTKHIYLAGVSEGSLVSVLASEQYPEVFDGSLALCGPIGDFQKQINYFGDFRVVFDYFFPQILPPSPIDIPSMLMEGWENIYSPAIINAILSDPLAAAQVLRVTHAPVDPTDLTTIPETFLSVLWYNVFATNNAQEVLGGQPFDNMMRLYKGSLDNAKLNQQVQRFPADESASGEINANYQTSGKINIPLVTMHTTGDQIVPFWHQLLYLIKAKKAQSLSNVTSLPIPRYGHCNFTSQEVLLAFSWLVYQVEGQQELPFQSQVEVLKLQDLYLPAIRR